MSKGNMFLGFARGKVGDVVFTRANGEQVTRVRNREPRNPRTPRQGVQRSILKTVAQAYSVMSLICDHSFEGLAKGTPNQSRFSRVNIDKLRSRVNVNVNLSDDADILAATITNYAPSLLATPIINDYTVSEGSLPQVITSFNAGIPVFDVDVFSPTNMTYQDLVRTLSAERGDQLTFMWLYGDDSDAERAGLITGFEVSRLIIDPSDGDMTQKLIATGGAVNHPNEANSGRIFLDGSVDNKVGFLPFSSGQGIAGGERVIIAAAAILSRRYAGNWRRSTQILSLRSGLTNNIQSWPLGDAVSTFLAPEQGSSLYLNQAENF